VLVGHSYGGVVIARLAEEIPDRIRRLVFWNAFVPQAGNSLNDEVPPHYRALFEQLSAASPDKSVMLPYPIWREAFINDADEALAKSSYESLSRSHTSLLWTKSILRAFTKLKFPRATSTAPKMRRYHRGNGVGIHACRTALGCTDWSRCLAVMKWYSPIRPC
jgi:pimeloyl-ACP methyl ester carboxylesterase